MKIATWPDSSSFAVEEEGRCERGLQCDHCGIRDWWDLPGKTAHWTGHQVGLVWLSCPSDQLTNWPSGHWSSLWINLLGWVGTSIDLCLRFTILEKQDDIGGTWYENRWIKFCHPNNNVSFSDIQDVPVIFRVTFTASHFSRWYQNNFLAKKS